MNYILMHRQIPVMEMTLDSVRCAVTKIGKVYHKEHLPVGIPVKRGMVDRAAVNAWWVNRAIPDSRQGLRQALEALRIPKAQMLPEHCLGLNLSDQYWVCYTRGGKKISKAAFNKLLKKKVGNTKATIIKIYRANTAANRNKYLR